MTIISPIYGASFREADRQSFYGELNSTLKQISLENPNSCEQQFRAVAQPSSKE
jgi:hypothetical protein